MRNKLPSYPAFPLDMREMSVFITGEQKLNPETRERMAHGRPAIPQPAAGPIVVDYDLELHHDELRTA